jgi:hypothetical protein
LNVAGAADIQGDIAGGNIAVNRALAGDDAIQIPGNHLRDFQIAGF